MQTDRDAGFFGGAGKTNIWLFGVMSCSISNIHACIHQQISGGIKDYLKTTTGKENEAFSYFFSLIVSARVGQMK